MGKQRRSFGRIRTYRSGRYAAAYVAPTGELIRAPHTFGAKIEAEGWLARVKREIELGVWRHPDDRAAEEAAAAGAALLFRDYAETFLAERDLRPRTRAHYRSLLDRFLLPAFGDVALDEIDRRMVRRWHVSTATETPTLRSHAYALLRTILNAALRDELIDRVPAAVEGGGRVKRRREIRPASVAELEALVAATPDRFQVMVLLAAWCGLRFGEVTELRRSDVDVAAGLLRIRRAVTYVDGEFVVGPPKTDAGIRDVNVPPHLMPAVDEHLRSHVGAAPSALLFPAGPGGHLGNWGMRAWFDGARDAAGRGDLRFHDLRHTGAVLAAQSGATLAELMGRLGHSTAGAALMYQHAAAGRDAAIAARLSELARGSGAGE